MDARMPMLALVSSMPMLSIADWFEKGPLKVKGCPALMNNQYLSIF
jgi:hypothetical protein